MSARAYFMKKVNGCKDVSIMSLKMNIEDGPVYCVCILQYCSFLILLNTTLCSQNINKQILNVEDEILTDYSFFSRYHFTKWTNFLNRRYRIRH